MRLRPHRTACGAGVGTRPPVDGFFILRIRPPSITRKVVLLFLVPPLRAWPCAKNAASTAGPSSAWSRSISATARLRPPASFSTSPTAAPGCDRSCARRKRCRKSLRCYYALVAGCGVAARSSGARRPNWAWNFPTTDRLLRQKAQQDERLGDGALAHAAAADFAK